MPYAKKNLQTWVKITVYFTSGTKIYKMAIAKKPQFLKNLKARTDVIKHTAETVKNYVY